MYGVRYAADGIGRSASNYEYISEAEYNAVNEMVNITRAMPIKFIAFLRNDHDNPGQELLNPKT